MEKDKKYSINMDFIPTLSGDNSIESNINVLNKLKENSKPKSEISRESEMSPALKNYLNDNHILDAEQQPKLQSGHRIDLGLKDMVLNSQINGPNLQQDPFKNNKPIMGDFRDPNLQNQFYERYATHPEFKKLGFTPFRDNERLYNEHSSTWEDISRAAGQWGALASLGFKDGASFGELSDTKLAKAFQRAMAIGSTSKTGVGAFATNLFLNTAYTVGIMGELTAEEVGMSLGEAALGLGIPFTGGMDAPAMGELGVEMGEEGYRVGRKVYKAYKMMSKLGKELSSLKDINKARKFFKTGLTGVGNFFNPFENGTDFLRNINKVKELKDLKNWQKTVKGFGAFYSDARIMRLAYGEGALEGGMVQNQLERDLLQDFINKNGRHPNRKEAADIRTTAKKAGASTAIANMPLIFLTDKITFDGLLRGKFKRLNNSSIITKAGEIIVNPKKLTEKEITEGIKKQFIKAPKTLKGKIKLNVSNPMRVLSKGFKYFDANFSEGLQEISQDVISGTNKDYYKDKVEGNPLRGGYMHYIVSNIRKQTSAQGFNTFMSGFLMGGMIAPISNTIAVATQGKQGFKNNNITRIGGKIYDVATKIKYKNDPVKMAEYQEKQETEKTKDEETLNKELNLLNDFYSNPMEYLSPDFINLIEQDKYAKAMQEAQKNGDKMLYVDLKDAAGFKNIATAIKYGRLDTFIERMEDMQKLSDDEIKESWNVDPAEYKQALQKTVERAKHLDARYKYAQERFENPFNPYQYKRYSDNFKDMALRAHAWDETVENFVYNQISFERALERQKKILGKAKDIVGLGNTAYSDFNILFNRGDLLGTIRDLYFQLKGDKKNNVKGIENYNAVTDEMKKLTTDKEKQYNTLKAFDKALEDLITTAEPTKEQHKALEDAYKDYINYLTNKNKDYTNDDNIKESLQGLLDYYQLDNRAKEANNTVNELMDPNNFKAQYERTRAIGKIIMDNRKIEIKRSLTKFLDLIGDNKILQKLKDAGMFIEPKDFIALKEKNIMPKNFYYVNEKNQWKEEVGLTTADYNKAVSILSKKYPNATGIKITEKAKDPYYSESRTKNKNDKRTYVDYANYFEFNPEAESTEKSLKLVLKKIVNSKYANKREKILAQQLLRLVKPGEIVTFVKRGVEPGHYSASAKEQTTIDARYSSQEYEEGNHAIENVILTQEVHRRVSEGLENDPTFKSTLKSLMEESVKAFNKMSNEDKLKLSETTAPFQGFKSIEDFASEALTNPIFQRFLATIETDTKTDKSVWKKFVDSVLNLFKNLFKHPNGTVLNAVLNVVTNKIDNKEEPPQNINNKKTDTKNKQDLKPTTITSEIQDDEYNNFINTGYVSQIRVVMMANHENFTDREKVLYNEPKIAKRIEAIRKAKKEKIPEDKSIEIFNKMSNLGYSKLAVSEMSMHQIHTILAEQLTKKEREDFNNFKEKEKNIKKESEKEKQSKIIKNNIAIRIDEADTIEDLIQVETAILGELGNNPDYRIIANISANDIKKLINEKKNKLKYSFTFEDINEGDTVILYNNDNKNDIGENYKAVVIDKNKNTLILSYKKANKDIKVKKKNVKKVIKYKYSEAMENAEIENEKVKPTEEDKKIAKETINNELKISSDELDDLREKGKNKTDEEANNDITNLIC